MNNHFIEEVRKMRRREGEKTLAAFTCLYLADHVKINPSSAHLAIYKCLDQAFIKRGTKNVIAAPRGFGKTTLITLANILYSICYRKEPYIMVLSHTKSQACQILESVKRELENNQKLRDDFPELLSAKPKPWSREQLQTLNGVRVAAFGFGQSIRGRKHGQYRPSLVICDDLEKADLTFNVEVKEKLRSWFEQAALEIGNSETNYMLIGNFYHPECLLGDYIDEQKHPNWTKLVYRAIVSWPKNMALWDAWAKVYNSREAFENKKGTEAATAFFRANEAQMIEGSEVLWPEKWTLYELMEKHENGPI